ncbi:hypothetical protein VIGAN_05052200, partial [Vigna angularis var. angularis]
HMLLYFKRSLFSRSTPLDPPIILFSLCRFRLLHTCSLRSGFMLLSSSLSLSSLKVWLEGSFLLQNDVRDKRFQKEVNCNSE